MLNIETEGRGTPLWRGFMEWCQENGAESSILLYGPLPYMVSVRLGEPGGDYMERDYPELRGFCMCNIGRSRSFAQSGEWCSGGAIVRGETWFAFATEEALRIFRDEYGDRIISDEFGGLR